jgi:hypothetical protein
MHWQLSHRISLPTLASVTISTLLSFSDHFMPHDASSLFCADAHVSPLHVANTGSHSQPGEFKDASSSCWKVTQQVSHPVPVMTLSPRHCLRQLLLRHCPHVARPVSIPALANTGSFALPESSCGPENFHFNHVAHPVSLPAPCQH